MKVPTKISFETGVRQIKNEQKVEQRKDMGLDGFNELLRNKIEEMNGEGNFPNATPYLQMNRLLNMVLTLQTKMNDVLLSLFTESDQEDTPFNLPLDRVILKKTDVPAESLPSKIRHVFENAKGDGSKTDFDPTIDHASKRYGVSGDLIKAVIKAESDFNPNCTSSKGAMGLMQLMPETAKELGVKDAYNPVENIMAGTRYLKSLLERYEDHIPTALAAYNWGMGNVERHPGRLPRETQVYIARVNKYLHEAKS